MAEVVVEGGFVRWVRVVESWTKKSGSVSEIWGKMGESTEGVGRNFVGSTSSGWDWERREGHQIFTVGACRRDRLEQRRELIG